MSDLLKAKDAAKRTPASILLSAYFAEHCGAQLPADITPFDIEAARVSWSIDMEMQARRAGGEQAAQARSAAMLKATRNAARARREAAKMKRTPRWADLMAIKAVYFAARDLTVSTGIEHQVDHIVPLQGRLVSGLHVHNNLQILTRSENARKHNHFEVEG